MAKKKLDDDLDLGIEKGAGSKKKLIIVVAAVVLLLVAGGAGWFLFGGSSEGDQPQEAAAEEPVEESPPIYHSLAPVFVVNLPPGGRAKMLQVGVDVMARKPELIEFLKHNDPMIRNNLLSLFGTQEGDALRSREGKEQLQKAVLEALNGIVEKQAGPGRVEAVYFTSFVMQ